VDSYFGKEDTVSGIFDQEVSALIPGIFEGTNATVFAYGATGSGKTYTMQVSNLPSSSLARNVFGEMSPWLLR
jgi:kinesin family protein 22